MQTLFKFLIIAWIKQPKWRRFINKEQTNEEDANRRQQNEQNSKIVPLFQQIING